MKNQFLIFLIIKMLLQLKFIVGFQRIKAIQILFFYASNQNHILAQYYVGKCYKKGYGIIKDETIAFKYYEQIANQDFAVGQLILGNCYQIGDGIDKDMGKAIYWYEKSAE